MGIKDDFIHFSISAIKSQSGFLIYVVQPQWY